MPSRRSYRLRTGRAFAVLPTLNRIIFSVVSLHVFYRIPDRFQYHVYVYAKDAPFEGASFVRIHGRGCQALGRVRNREIAPSFCPATLVGAELYH